MSGGFEHQSMLREVDVPCSREMMWRGGEARDVEKCEAMKKVMFK